MDHKLTRDEVLDLSLKLARHLLKNKARPVWADDWIFNCPCCEFVYQQYGIDPGGFQDWECADVCPLWKVWEPGPYCNHYWSPYYSYVMLGNRSAMKEIVDRIEKLIQENRK